MSVSGLCQLCESATATHQCPRCGRLACSAHFDEERNRCVDCLGGETMGESETTSTDRTYRQ